MSSSDNALVLQKVRRFAEEAHGNQKRKYSSDPYIVHPERVMEICRQYSDDLPLLSAALLHDVLEDTPVTKNQMREFLLSVMSQSDADKTTRLVVELTDVYVHEKFPHLNRRSRKERERNRMATVSSDSQTIKYADIIDNCREIVTHDPDFARVFLRECEALLKEMKSGNKTLYRQAKDDVDAGLKALRSRPAH